MYCYSEFYIHCSVHHYNCFKNCTLITETEQAIRKLHSKIQEPYRILAAKKLKQIKKAECQQNTTAKREFYTVNKLKEKLVKENAMIVKADKGRTSVIIYTED